MSVQLVQLLELSHDLARARKRRLEWEACPTAADSGPATEGEGFGEDAAEMELLRASLRTRGLAPRAPDAEHAFLRLVSADRSVKAQTLGPDLEWLACPVAQTAPSGSAELLCPPKSKAKTSGSDDTFLRLLAVSCDDEGLDTVARIPSEVFNTDVRGRDMPADRPAEEGAASTRLPAALERLRALVSSGSRDDASTTDSIDDVWETGSLPDEDLEFVAEIAQEAMAEAEREELAEVLAEQAANEVADAVNQCSISA